MSDTDPPPQKYGLKAKEFKTENTPATAPAPSVHEILWKNLSRQQTFEAEKPMDLTDRRTKRARDYWLVMSAGNGLGGFLWLLLPANPYIPILIPGGLVMFNLGLYWVMFQVMDKY